jgi:hypothetical protein
VKRTSGTVRASRHSRRENLSARLLVTPGLFEDVGASANNNNDALVEDSWKFCFGWFGSIQETDKP